MRQGFLNELLTNICQTCGFCQQNSEKCLELFVWFSLDCPTIIVSVCLYCWPWKTSLEFEEWSIKSSLSSSSSSLLLLLLSSFLLLISLQPKQEDEDKLCEFFPSKKDNVRAALEAVDGDLDRAACLLAEGTILEFITVIIFFDWGLKTYPHI